MREESIWGKKDLIGRKAFRGGKDWRRKAFGEERFNWMESIWGRRALWEERFIGGKHLGEEKFNWMESIWGRKD